MTLSPVFKDTEKLAAVIEALGERGFNEALAVQKNAVSRLFSDLKEIIGDSSLDPSLESVLAPESDATFAQRYFFITLFTLIFKTMGIEGARLDFYARMNYCIMGTTAAADNLFDSEDKLFLPLKADGGAIYHSVLQLMCFERLAAKTGRCAIADGVLDEGQFAEIQKGIFDTMADIGSLEGSEEGGVDDIPSPSEMVRDVHGVRGGLLFSLATIAPSHLEASETLKMIGSAAEAIRSLGTAFQIVDDISDFEFDLSRKSHNILVSEIHHNGTAEERAALESVWHAHEVPGEFVENNAMSSATRALSTAVELIADSLASLDALGFSIDEEMSKELAVAFASTRGTPRLEAVSALL